MALTDYNRRTMGDVQDHVEPVADEVTDHYPVAFLWGRSSGTSGEHPLGLALDFSVLAYGDGVNDPGPADFDKGDDIAAYLWANRHRLNVWYIIWNRRIISTNPDSYAYGEWTPYNGSNPHTDHVHVSHYAGRTYQPPDDLTEEPDMSVTRADLDEVADRIEAHVVQRTYARVNDADRERYGYQQNLYMVGRLVADASMGIRKALIRVATLEAKQDLLIQLVRGAELTAAEVAAVADEVAARVEIILDEAGVFEEPTEVGTVEGGGPDGPTQS